MRVAALICMVLLMDHAAALLLTRQQNYSPAQGGPRYSNHSLDCREGRLVLVVNVEIVFRGRPCCTGATCSFSPSVADFQRYLEACDNTSLCRLSVQDLQQQCGETTASPEHASVSYVCSSASAVLAMDRPGSTSGRTVAARFSSPDLQSSNSSWQCRVETSDCSNLASTVELHIRNAELQSSSFFSSKDIEGLGRVTLQREVESVTPFSVDLHLLNGSRVQPAYMLVTADVNITMICGIRSATPSTTFCNQCASSPCQEGFECVNLPGNFSCVAAPTAETTTPKNSAVAPAAGGGVAALVVIAGIVAIACASRK